MSSYAADDAAAATPLAWIDVDDRLPTRSDLVVLVWAKIASEPVMILRPLIDMPLGHACITMARYAPAWTDGWLVPAGSLPTHRRWLLVPGDEPFKFDVVRRWAEFNLPLPEERS